MRPRHAEAVPGFVVAVDRGRYTCLVDGHKVTAMRARELGRKSVVVGDHVSLVGDITGRPDTLARIVRIDTRRSVLRRTADDDDPTERVIVANADQLVIVSSLHDPPPRTGFIDRCLVAAYDADIEPLLCLTKSDLLESPDQVESAPVLGYYADLELRHVTVSTDQPLDALQARLTDRLSVLVGQSGVGKSTLVNRLAPGADRAVGVVSAIGKGRHTSASAVALKLPDGGWIVDTPGVRSFGLAHVSPRSLLHGFSDLSPGAAECPPGCEHTDEAIDCALDAWAADGNADPRRLASYRRLLDSRGDSGPSDTTRG
ncbi:MAG: ribosome small subunit-dependent GTPase A [Micromonosporaceae bacterium]